MIKKLIFALFLLVLPYESHSHDLIGSQEISWDRKTQVFIYQFKKKQIKTEIKKYDGTGKLTSYFVLFSDGSRAEMSFMKNGAKGAEMYEDETSADKKIKGVRIQYYPDSSQGGYPKGTPLYNGKFPAMVIHVHNDGRGYQFGFKPDGTKKEGFVFENKGQTLLFSESNRF